jgi:hypothetical protein
MGVRPDSALGLAMLGVAFAGFGLFRIVNDDRIGWLLVGAGVLAFAAAWWRIGHPPEA